MLNILIGVCAFSLIATIISGIVVAVLKLLDRTAKKSIIVSAIFFSITALSFVGAVAVKMTMPNTGQFDAESDKEQFTRSDEQETTTPSESINTEQERQVLITEEPLQNEISLAELESQVQQVTRSIENRFGNDAQQLSVTIGDDNLEVMFNYEIGVDDVEMAQILAADAIQDIIADNPNCDFGLFGIVCLNRRSPVAMITYNGVEYRSVVRGVIKVFSP